MNVTAFIAYLNNTKGLHLDPQGECLHGDGMLRGSYWGQRALADHRDALETFAHDRLRRKLCGRLRQVHCR